MKNLTATNRREKLLKERGSLFQMQLQPYLEKANQSGSSGDPVGRF
jgi:hypothetical protein